MLHRGDLQEASACSASRSEYIHPHSLARVVRIQRYHPAATQIEVDYQSQCEVHPPGGRQHPRRSQWLRVRPCRRPAVANSYCATAPPCSLTSKTSREPLRPYMLAPNPSKLILSWCRIPHEMTACISHSARSSGRLRSRSPDETSTRSTGSFSVSFRRSRCLLRDPYFQTYPPHHPRHVSRLRLAASDLLADPMRGARTAS